MMKNIKVVAMDLDGTLTNSQKKITQRTRKAIDSLRENGIKIVLASGRPHIGIKTVSDALEMDNLGGYILSYNGGAIYDCNKNDYVFKQLISREYYKKIYEISKRFEDVFILTYDNEMVLCENDTDRYVKQEAFNCSLKIKKVDNLFECVKNEDIVKFEIVGEHEKLEPVREMLQDCFGDNLAVYYSEPYFLEVVASGISKSNSLDMFLKKNGCTKENLVAIGDGLNDLSMIEFAGVGVAMDNAVSRVKNAAQIITSSNDDDGVAKFIEEYLL